MDTLQTIATRCSTRSYKPDMITDDELGTILLAGNAAPVGRRAYDTLHMTIIKNRSVLDEITANYAAIANRQVADPFHGAPLVVLLSASIQSHVPGVEYCNAACILENMSLMATELGIGSVYLFGFIPSLNANPELERKLGIPEHMRAVSCLCLGYPNEPFKVKDPLQIHVHIDMID